MLKDYYRILSVRPNASQADIRKRFNEMTAELRALSEADQDGEASERFDDLLEAYAVLSDARRKRAYDRQCRLRNVVPAPQEPARATRKPAVVRQPPAARSLARARNETFGMDPAIRFMIVVGTLASWTGLSVLAYSFLVPGQAVFAGLVGLGSLPLLYGGGAQLQHYFALHGERILIGNHWGVRQTCLNLSDIRQIEILPCGPLAHCVRIDTVIGAVSFRTLIGPDKLRRLVASVTKRQPSVAVPGPEEIE